MDSIVATYFVGVPNVLPLLNNSVVMGMQHIHLTRPPWLLRLIHANTTSFASFVTVKLLGSLILWMLYINYWGSEHSDPSLSRTAVTLARRETVHSYTSVAVMMTYWILLPSLSISFFISCELQLFFLSLNEWVVIDTQQMPKRRTTLVTPPCSFKHLIFSQIRTSTVSRIASSIWCVHY